MAGMTEQSARVTIQPVVRNNDTDSVLRALQGDDDALASFAGQYQRATKRVRENYDGDYQALLESIDEGFGGLEPDRRGSAGQSTLGESPDREDADRSNEEYRRRREQLRDSEAEQREDEQMDLYTAGATKRLDQWEEDDDEDDRGGSGN